MNTRTNASYNLGYRPSLSNAGLEPTFETKAVDNLGEDRIVQIAEERPLTIFLDNREIVTLMTLGVFPELLALGYLRNQGLVEYLESISSVHVDWTQGRVDVVTFNRREIFSGSTYNENMAPLSRLTPKDKLPQSKVYKLLKNLASANKVYRTAGGVHGCAVCNNTEALSFVEDIGRHNAADTIGGYMWLNRIDGVGKQLYCTGRLTSEIVIKAARMKISTLLSRSGITRLGLEIAKELNITLIARAKGDHFLIYHGHDTILYDISKKDDL